MSYMMATAATHKLGDLSREEPSLCVVSDEDGDCYVGHWVEGFGYVNVRFPKETTRDLTEDEKDHYDGLRLMLGDAAVGKLAVRP